MQYPLPENNSDDRRQSVRPIRRLDIDIDIPFAKGHEHRAWLLAQSLLVTQRRWKWRRDEPNEIYQKKKNQFVV